MMNNSNLFPVKYNEYDVSIIRSHALLRLKDNNLYNPHQEDKDLIYLCNIINWFKQNLDEEDKSGTFGVEGWQYKFNNSNLQLSPV